MLLSDYIKQLQQFSPDTEVLITDEQMFGGFSVTDHMMALCYDQEIHSLEVVSKTDEKKTYSFDAKEVPGELKRGYSTDTLTKTDIAKVKTIVLI